MRTTTRRALLAGAPTALTAAILALVTLATPAPAAAQATSRSTTEVPLEVRGGRMVVPVSTADGQELRFLVTTGSAVTVLSESGAAKVGDQALTVGDVAVNLEGAQTVADARLTVEGMVMDGLLSNNTLSDFDVLFDVPGGRLVLKPFGRAVEWPGMELSEPVRLRLYHGVVLGMDVEIDGTEYPAVLELGAPALLVNEAVLDENGITDGTADLTLGMRTFSGLPIEVSDHPVIARFSLDGTGVVLIGTPPALDCALAISWVHQELRTCVR